MKIFDEINEFHSNLREVMLYIKYSKDKKTLNKVVKEDIKFQSIERQAAEVINVVTGSKLKYPEGKGQPTTRLVFLIFLALQYRRIMAVAISCRLGDVLSHSSANSLSRDTCVYKKESKII